MFSGLIVYLCNENAYAVNWIGVCRPSWLGGSYLIFGVVTHYSVRVHINVILD